MFPMRMMNQQYNVGAPKQMMQPSRQTIQPMQPMQQNRMQIAQMMQPQRQSIQPMQPQRRMVM